MGFRFVPPQPSLPSFTFPKDRRTLALAKPRPLNLKTRLSSTEGWEQSSPGLGQESVCCSCLLFRSAGVLSERTGSPGAPVYLLATCHLRSRRAAPLMDPSARPTPSRCSDEGHAASAVAPLMGWRLAPSRSEALTSVAIRNVDGLCSVKDASCL